MIVPFDGIHPSFSESVNWVAPNATLIGRVILEVDASVWFGAVLRGDNEPITVGRGSNVQDLCVLHTDPGFPLKIGERCTIGHAAILHGCQIGDGSLIGMGAILLNGCIIGKECLIAAGALVPEGMIIPDHSLVIGTPGRIRRTLELSEIEKIQRNTLSYIQKSKRYM
jgi:carbonic anhydrase/acetyltransferase-like protein (isoleucine patch superfamily)